VSSYAEINVLMSLERWVGGLLGDSNLGVVEHAAQQQFSASIQNQQKITTVVLPDWPCLPRCSEANI